MRDICVARACADARHTNDLPSNHFVCCVKIEAHCVIGASFGPPQRKNVPPINQKNPRAHKNKIGTSPPPQKPPLKRRNFTDMVFPAERTHFFQVSIKLAQPFPAPELQTKILRTRGFFWIKAPPPHFKSAREVVRSVMGTSEHPTRHWQGVHLRSCSGMSGSSYAATLHKTSDISCFATPLTWQRSQNPPRLKKSKKKSLRESLWGSLRGSWQKPTKTSQKWVSGVKEKVIFDSQSLQETRFWLERFGGRPGPSESPPETLPETLCWLFEPGRVLTPLPGRGGSQLLQCFSTTREGFVGATLQSSNLSSLVTQLRTQGLQNWSGPFKTGESWALYDICQTVDNLDRTTQSMPWILCFTGSRRSTTVIYPCCQLDIFRRQKFIQYRTGVWKSP